MMKKTLVALAAVAATGGAFAQSVLTGDFSFGYSSSTSAASGTANGMGMGDADIYWATTEDLEGGGKLGVNLALDLSNNTAAYGQAAVVGDETMSYKSASGLIVVVGSVKAGDYLSAGIASAGSGYNQTLDNALFTSRTFKDQITVSLPVADGITLSLQHREAGTGMGAGAASTGVGAQRDATVGLKYAAGPLVVDGGYRVIDGTSLTSTTLGSSLNRASASYDMGVAKIGAGYQTTVYGYGNSQTDTLAGITVPVSSAFSLGAQVGYRAKSGNATSSLNTTMQGAIYSASYTLSKRTSILASYMAYDAVANTTQTTGFFKKKKNQVTFVLTVPKIVTVEGL